MVSTAAFIAGSCPERSKDRSRDPMERWESRRLWGSSALHCASRIVIVGSTPASMTQSKRLSAWCGTVLLSLASLYGQEVSSPQPAFPVNAITAILDAFRSHSVVALGEGPHGNEQGHAF